MIEAEKKDLKLKEYYKRLSERMTANNPMNTDKGREYASKREKMKIEKGIIPFGGQKAREAREMEKNIQFWEKQYSVITNTKAKKIRSKKRRALSNLFSFAVRDARFFVIY